MKTSVPALVLAPERLALVVCAAAIAALMVAMGVGRFAFTPLFPLMIRDGLLDSQSGALLAASNYVGYFAGALAASRLRIKPAALMALGLAGTVVATAAVGWASSVPAWAMWRLLAGVASAWTLVGTSAWGLGWLAAMKRPHLAGTMFAGVGLGIAAAGLFCLAAAGPGLASLTMWVDLAGIAAVTAIVPLTVIWRLPAPTASAAAPTRHADVGELPAPTGGLVVCYTLFGFGYILPATYLPAMARRLVDDPHVFGWAWPLFGAAAAVSTVVVAWRLQTASRLRIWAVCHGAMAAGVLLPVIVASLASVVASALLVGGTFMVVTMIGTQEARSRAPGHATAILGRMTAGFAFGQLMGPVVSSALLRFTPDDAAALHLGLALAAAGLLGSAFYLWRQDGALIHIKEHA